MAHCTVEIPELTIGLDVGDRWCHYALLSRAGKFEAEDRVRTTGVDLRAFLQETGKARVVLEVGTHSGWISRLVEELGHEVVVANARNVAAIHQSSKKTDKTDARTLAELGRVSVRLLSPIKHRGVGEQRGLGVLRARDTLVQCRTKLVNHVKCVVKSWGCRIEGCSARTFGKRALEQIPQELKPVLQPVITTIAELTEKIYAYDRVVKKFCEKRYPVAEHLMEIPGVGPITALAYVLVIGDPRRFSKRRSVASYLGLVPRQDESGDSKPQLPITKQGDGFLRRLLVGSAQYILGPFGGDCDLRRKGLEIARRGGKNAKRRAVVAVARRLAVLLHRLWITGEVYEPFRQDRGKRRRSRRPRDVKITPAVGAGS